MNSEQCVEYILSIDEKKRNEAFEYLYSSCFSKVKSFVLQNSGTMDEAKDIFQDTAAVLYRNIQLQKFNHQSSINSYTFAIAKNLWLMELRRRKVLTTSAVDEQQIEESENEINATLLHKVLDHLDASCKELLVGFYFYRKSMKDITRQFGLSSEQVAKTKKLRCMKKLRDIVQRYRLDQKHFML